MPSTPPSPERRLSIDDHRRELDGYRYVYPVLSRRARGISIGINLNPDKACNFDCIYCQVDRRTPGFKGVEPEAVYRELEKLLSRVKDGSLFRYPPFDSVEPRLQRVNDISFSGDGEPTSAREFPDVLRSVIDLRSSMGMPELKLILITNATRFHRPAVHAALLDLAAAGGSVWGKLDAGTEEYYRKIDVSHIPFAQIVTNLEIAARIAPLTIQSLFVDWEEARLSPDEIRAYADRLRGILAAGGRIRAVQVHTIARKPPHDNVFALPDEALEAIARIIRRHVDIPVEVYHGHPRFQAARRGISSQADAWATWT